MVQGRVVSPLGQEFEVCIGLEIHCQLRINRKLFSFAPSQIFGKDENTCVSFVDAGFPGMLPVLNEEAVRQGIRMGLAVQATINLHSVFERKNYFYPDNPSGYQISQHRYPLVENGTVYIDLEGEEKSVRIQRIHLEQDAGKSVHDRNPSKSLIDFNRAGIALIEIVTYPDLSSGQEAALLIKKIRTLGRYVKALDGNMEKGEMRADVNISIRKPGGDLGTRVELKNMNSVRFIQQAIEYEVNRHMDIIDRGEMIVQETRGFNPDTGATFEMRVKEEANDYRYFPEPDLPPLILDETWVKEMYAHIPELPDVKKKRYMNVMKLSLYDASLLTEVSEVAAFFEKAAQALETQDPNSFKLLANWMLGSLFAYLQNKEDILAEVLFQPESLAELVTLIVGGKISHGIAKDVFDEMWKTGRSAQSIVEEKGLSQVSDHGQIQKWVEEVLQEEQDHVDAYLSGKDKLFGFFVGQTMKKAKGKANPAMIQSVMKEVLTAKQNSSGG